MSPPASEAPVTPLVVLDLKGTMVKVFNDSFGLVRLADGQTLVLATIQVTLARYFLSFTKEGTLYQSLR